MVAGMGQGMNQGMGQGMNQGMNQGLNQGEWTFLPPMKGRQTPIDPYLQAWVRA